MVGKIVLRIVKSINDLFDLQRFLDAQTLSSEYASYGPEVFPPSYAAVRAPRDGPRGDTA